MEKPKLFIHIVYITAMVALLTVYFIETRSNLDNVKAKDAEMKAKIREKQKEFDALKKDYALRGDSILIAFNTIRLAHSETEKAKEKEREAVRRSKDVRFVRYETDSARNKALSKLYKTYNP